MLIIASIVAGAAAGIWWACREVRAARADLADTRHRIRARRATADEAHARNVIEAIGRDVGAAPAATARLGEHVIAPVVVDDVAANPAGGWDHTFVPAPTGAIWYGPDGLDTHRNLDGALTGQFTLTLATGPLPVGTAVNLPWTITRDGDGVRLDLPTGPLDLTAGFPATPEP